MASSIVGSRKGCSVASKLGGCSGSAESRRLAEGGLARKAAAARESGMIHKLTAQAETVQY